MNDVDEVFAEGAGNGAGIKKKRAAAAKKKKGRGSRKAGKSSAPASKSKSRSKASRTTSKNTRDVIKNETAKTNQTRRKSKGRGSKPSSGQGTLF